MDDSPTSYLYEIPDREAALIDQFTAGPPLFEQALLAFGINPAFCWLMIRPQMELLAEDMMGDVDLLAGNLEWNDPAKFQDYVAQEVVKCPDAHPANHALWATIWYAAAGGLRWPPSLGHLAGIEAKVAYLHPQDLVVKARHSQPESTRQQVDKLLTLGVDRAGLLDFITTPPSSGEGSQAWTQAGAVALYAYEDMQQLLANRLLPTSPAGHWFFSIGAVDGKSEWMAGATVFNQIRPSAPNPLLLNDANVQGRRKRMEHNLNKLLGALKQPFSTGIVLTLCPLCQRMHYRKCRCEEVFVDHHH